MVESLGNLERKRWFFRYPCFTTKLQINILNYILFIYTKRAFWSKNINFLTNVLLL